MDGAEGVEEVTEAPQTQISLLDVSLLEEYLESICPNLGLVENDAEKNLLHKCLQSPETTVALTKFIADPKNPLLFLQRINKDDSVRFSISLEISIVGDKISGGTFMKKNSESVLESTKSAASQLQVMVIGEDSPIDAMHTYIQHSFTQLFRSYMKAQSQKLGSGAAAVGQKIAELELSLQNCKQSILIESIDLKIHPEITAAAKRAHDEGRVLKPEDLGNLSQNEDFLNSLQGIVNVWIREIQKVTKMERIDKMPANAETAQEVKFWLELDGELRHIEDQLKTEEAECTLAILKYAKRFITTASFDTDTIGLKKAIKKVASYKSMMKDFPINQLLTLSEIEKIPDALINLFTHMKKASKGSEYPVQRYLRLIEAISRDLCNKVLSILQRKRLMYLDYDEFEKVTSESLRVFTVWEDQFEQFREALRELARKRNQGQIPLRIIVEHKPLQERVSEIRRFRRQHNELKSVVTRVLTSSHENDAIKEINGAYDEIKDKEVLLLSKEGGELWDAALKKYESRIDRVEGQITNTLRDRLATAKNANEMFRVFSKFNALFVRPRIKGAIQEYQTQLIQRVKQDIASLHDKFKQKYNASEAYHMSQLRDLPPVSGAIIWARQLERQLDTYLQRVEDVLGKGWELDVEGQNLKKDGDNFRRKLNTDQIFEKWVKETDSRTLEVAGRILDVVKKGNKLHLDINFDSQIIVLFKEVRNLQWLGFRVPFSITLLSGGAKQVYPFAVSLKETIRTYIQTIGKVSPEISTLVAVYKKDVQDRLNEGFRLKWEALSKLDPYVRRFSEAVITLRDKVDELLVKHQVITQALETLKTCPLKKAIFAENLLEIQNVIDELNLGYFSNLPIWVENLNKQIEDILLERLQESITAWNRVFESAEDGRSGQRGRPAKQLDAPDQNLPKPELQTSVHEIVIRNQIMNLNPPLEHARVNWVSQLHAWLGIICNLNRIQSSRYDEGLSHKKDEEVQKTFRDLLTRLPTGTLRKAYLTIENKLEEVNKYVNIWLQYQALWDMDSNTVYSQLGNDLNKWQQLLGEIKRARTTFDNSDTRKTFGPIIIDYKQVQVSVNNKYDYWHKDVISNFGSKLN